MKELTGLAGTFITAACEELAREAPAFMVFNGVRVESAVGETPADLHAKWRTAMNLEIEKRQRERAAYEQTDAGKKELAKAAAQEAEEKRVHDEYLRVIAASGVREKYPWGPGMKGATGGRA